MRKLLGLLLLLAAAGGIARAETPAAVLPNFSGLPFVHIFKDDGAPTAQIRAIRVHPNGLVYVGTPDGLFEFDGASWNLIPGTANKMMNDIEVDAAGRVWYSGPSMFGFLEPDARGVLRLHPLETALPADLGTLGMVGKILVAGDDIYLRVAQRRLLLHVDRHLAVRATPIGEGFSLFLSEGAVHVTTATRILRARAGGLEPAPAGPTFPPGIIESWPDASGGTWLVSALGLWHWRDGAARLVSPELTNLLQKDIVICAQPAGDGLVALGTALHGLVIMHEDGRVLARYGENEGLGFNGDTINQLDLDAEGGLWLAHAPSVIRLQLRTGAAIHNAATGLRGVTRTIALHRGRLHVGTTQGVFIHDPATGRFTAAPDAGTTVWALLPTEDGLFMAGNDLRLRRDDGTTVVVDSFRTEIVTLARLARDPDWIVASTNAGMRAYRRTGGQWAYAGTVPGITDYVYYLTADPAGWLWGSLGYKQLLRLDWRQGVRLDAKPEILGSRHGLDAFSGQRDDLRISLVEGQPLLSSALGLMRYLPGPDRFEPETRIEGFDSAAAWGRAFAQDDGSIWFFEANSATAGTGVARPVGPGRWQWERLPNTGLEPVDATAAREDRANHKVWINSRVLLSFDTRWRGARPGAPRPHIRRVTQEDHAVVWGGAGPPPALVLDPSARALQFAYAASSFHSDMWGRMKTEYRTRLAGFDRDWSDWSGETKRAYTNLPSGAFTFEVQARDFPGRVSETAALAFTITTPWWQTPLALALWLPLAAGVVLLFVRLRTRALRRRAAVLEAQIDARTRELKASNEELARLHQLDLDEKAAAHLAAEKAQLEMLRYQLNPHFLFNALNSVYGFVYPHSREAGDLVRHLADFCRQTLTRRSDDWHTLGEEFAILCTYLDIEQLRWQERLQVTFELEEAATTAQLPAFLLLPLVENAIKHGGATSPDRLDLRLAARLEADGTLHVTVANTGRWLAREEPRLQPSAHIGLENLRTRLERSFPGTHAFTTTAADGWVTVNLRLSTADQPATI